MNEARVKVAVHGVVQGVGFRPFVYKLAQELALCGWVLNAPYGVLIEAEGARPVLDRFLLLLERDKPPRAQIQSLDTSFFDTVGYRGFEIRSSAEGGAKTAYILPDLAACADCLRETFDPADRRYRYPFSNCTNCGPRFTIVEALPYDRPHTSMKRFVMCRACAREYDDPLDRRFHAQPIACADCGPELQLRASDGKSLAKGDDALCAAAAAVRTGRILALKGLGGFQLIVAARDEEAVRRLRVRKRRDAKPFASMYASLAGVKEDCVVSPLEERLLLSQEAPIVLLEARRPATVIAPENPYLGAMLPYTPLHHLLLRELSGPIVATSGNLSDEPICTDEREALVRLQGIADAFLVHDRPIVRHVDDSVVRVVLGRELMLRRARGYAPLPVRLPGAPPAALAVGPHLKNTVALSVGAEAFLSQHIGDLETEQAHAALQKAADDLPRLYAADLEVIACDLHPDYLSTRLAREMQAPCTGVQHHYAHVLSCMADNEMDAPVLGVAWDGTGYGTDGTIWGGEFLLVNETSFERVAHLRPFRLPGSAAAVREPHRCALGVLYEVFGGKAFGDDVPEPLRQMLVKGIRAPFTSSAGRLFDAVAAIIGVRRTRVDFEGQAAMALEFAVQRGVRDAYPIDVGDTIDWEPMVRALVSDASPPGVRAARFHNTLAEAIVRVARRVGEPRVALTGGCFQNRYLTEQAVQRLCEQGFVPYWHRRIPPNDGGIALGQLMAVAREHSARCRAHGADGT